MQDLGGQADMAGTTPSGSNGAQPMSGAPAPDWGTSGTDGGGTTPEASVDAIDRLLGDVEQALSRLDDGTYGECASCGTPIGDDRLAEDPTARGCADCER